MQLLLTRLAEVGRVVVRGLTANSERLASKEQGMMQELTSTRLGEYTLTQHLAHGGMSEVYLAHTKSSEQVYALKLVEQSDEESYQRFQREVQTLYKVRHIHILPLLDYGEEDGFSYYVMPYIEQGTLKERLQSGPLSLEEAERILVQVGEALQFLHASGVVHRDIKPANILLNEDGRAWLADLGLVKRVEPEQELTQTGCIIGTPCYMAPELFSQLATTRSDVYALGVVLYEMLTGQPPFDGNSPLEICWKHTTTPPPQPSMLNPHIPPAVESVILQALAKEPLARFSTPLDLVEAYHQALLEPGVPATPMLNWLTEVAEATTSRSVHVNIPEPAGQTYRRALIIGVLLAMLIVFGIFTLILEIQGMPGSGSTSPRVHHSTAASTLTPTAVLHNVGNAGGVQHISIPAQPGPSGGHHHKHQHNNE